MPALPATRLGAIRALTLHLRRALAYTVGADQLTGSFKEKEK
jgi:hypothetical protein